ncbi:MAG: alpha/beta fold hydrolase [Syntrophotaleaceae bacterium]
MKRFIWGRFLPGKGENVMKTLLILILMVFCANAAVFGAAENIEEAARDFVLLLQNEEFSKAVDLFDNNMKKAVTPDELRATWKGRQQKVGSFQEITGTRTESHGAYHTVFVTCRFEKRKLDLKVVYDQARKIAGLFFVRHQIVEHSTPEYLYRKAFKETEVQVGPMDRPLPGTLTVPIGAGPFPAVVLVHGSGPHDRDETIGPNKPFRDLAWGLASKGIAALRYEKRTRQYPTKNYDNITVQEETVADALEAVALLTKDKALKADRIFVLGHSLGGMLIPRIGKQESAIAGFVIMAGNARPLEDLFLDQTLYQASLAPELTPEAKLHIDQVKQQVAAIKNVHATNFSGSKMLGAPPSYWLELKGYSPTEVAKAMHRPLLIMQGEKDCQVSSEKDFKEWQRTLSGRKNVEFKLYPTLNHLFMEVDGRSTGADYQQPGNVAAIVISDIANWIKGLK